MPEQIQLNPELDPEMKKFFEKEVRPTTDALLCGTYQFELVQQQFSRNLTRILNLYGRIPSLILAINPPEFSGGEAPPFCCRINEEYPEVVIVVPNLMISHKLAKWAHELHLFSTFVAIGFMHEFDHHALKLVPGDKNVGKMIEAEKRVWARTCEKTIVPLVEIYSQDIGPLTVFYNAWIECGRDVDSLAWYSFIRENYQFIAKHIEQELASTDAAIAELFG